MISSVKISRTKKLPLIITVILLVALTILWLICGSGSPLSGHSDHGRGHSAVTDKNGGRPNAAEAGIREPERKVKDKRSKLNQPAKPDSAPPLSMDIQAFGENGQLTTQAIENLNLTSGEVASLTDLLSTVKEQAAADFVSRARLTGNLSTGDGGLAHTYFVNARPDRGMEFSTSLATGAEHLIGSDRAQRINSNISSLDFLGGAGKYHLNIVISSEGGEKLVKYEYLDPKNASVVKVRECSFDSFSRAFGDVFDYSTPNIPESK